MHQARLRCYYKVHPIAFKLQLGAQLAHPQALTQVSNWGERVQVTTLQLER
ncbi:MAG TPA: addiction module toxin RelE [Serratia sp.]|nr:addiction module toxin RelE [Serratia sp. (in: enterobacteria)]